MHGVAALQSGDPELGDDVALEGQLAAGRVEEAGCSRSGTRSPSMGEKTRTFEPMYCSTLVRTWKPLSYRRFAELVLVAPAIAAEPLRFGRFDEVHAEHELVLVDRAALRLIW